MATALSPEEIKRHLDVLNESPDPERLTASAIALASSEDPAAVMELEPLLRRAGFLDRLDPPDGDTRSVTNLLWVFRALADHPAPATGRLCESVYVDEGFRSVPARINLLLGALAAVRPMTAEAAAIFRETSSQGYAEVNGPLLIDNGSPPALEIFEEIIAGDWVDSEVKVSILHRAVLPARTRLAVITLCSRLLDRGLPAEVQTGIVETLFDYQSRRWFGPAMEPPEPPAWDTAATEGLRALIALAGRIERERAGDPLLPAVQATRKELEAILRSRLK
jgi:hypothetical protein